MPRHRLVLTLALLLAACAGASHDRRAPQAQTGSPGVVANHEPAPPDGTDEPGGNDEPGGDHARQARPVHHGGGRQPSSQGYDAPPERYPYKAPVIRCTDGTEYDEALLDKGLIDEMTNGELWCAPVCMNIAGCKPRPSP